MVDTFRPLELGEAGLAVEDPAYAWTWAGRGPDPDPDREDDDGDGGPAVFSNKLTRSGHEGGTPRRRLRHPQALVGPLR